MAAPKTPKTPAPDAQAAASPQLGLDFDAPAPVAEPAATPAAPLAQAAPAPAAPEWLSPELPPATERGMDALAMACAIQNAPLARALMDLPERWDFNGGHEPGVGPQEGYPGPLGHLLSAQQNHYWTPQGNQGGPGFDNITATALAMVERGADFLQVDKRGLSPLTLCAGSRRQEFFQHLAGHPRFTHGLMGQLRVGALPAESERGRAPAARDTRRPLLGHLILTGQLRSAEALISKAGFPPNLPDPDGRLPIGYCRSIEALDLLLSLGALPGLVDAEGLNALARAQDVPETETRDKMITRIANELKKEAKTNPSIMATLQSQNIAALLEAAQNAPKSSLLKTISAFKFDVAKARDPKTLLTPLMAACLGGRMASAQHLLAAGSDINAVDAAGVPASAYLLSGNETSNGPHCSALAAQQAPNIDFAIRSKRGWPVAVEAAFMMGASSVSIGWNSKPVDSLAQAMASSPLAFNASHATGDDGTSLMEAYAQGSALSKANNYRTGDNFSALMAIATRLKTPELLDRAVLAMFALNESNPSGLLGTYGAFAKILPDLQARVISSGEPCHQTALFLQSRPKLASEIAKLLPTLYASIETAELMAISAPGGEARKASRL